jgi:hypothetical protein
VHFAAPPRWLTVSVLLGYVLLQATPAAAATSPLTDAWTVAAKSGPGAIRATSQTTTAVPNAVPKSMPRL